MPGTRKLGRPTAHRNAMLRGMVTLLLANGQVETTLTRAKEETKKESKKAAKVEEAVAETVEEPKAE